MRLLFIETNLDPNRGGVERVTWQLSSYLTRHGVDIYYIFQGYDVTEIADDHKLQFDYKGDYEPFRDEVFRFIRDKQIDAIINQDTDFDNVNKLHCELHAAFPGIPLVYSFHIMPGYFKFIFDDLWFKVWRRIFRLLKGFTIGMKPKRLLYHHSDLFVLLSPSYIPQLSFEFGIPVRKLRVDAVPNPLSFPLQKFGDGTDGTLLPVTQRPKQFLIVARMAEFQKNLRTALRIWKEFESRDTQGYELVLAGYGPDRDMILEYADSLHLSRFRYIGHTAHPDTLYRQSRYIIMTSFFEGFAMTIVEAMQHGCVPIVLDTFTAIHDVIDSGTNGMIVPTRKFGVTLPSSVVDSLFSRAMLRLTSDEALTDSLSREANSSVRQFELDKVGVRWLNMLEKLHTNRSGQTF